MKYQIDHESISRLPNPLDAVDLIVSRMEPRRWQFPFDMCIDCETGAITSWERPYADCPGSSCNGCIYSYLDPVEGPEDRAAVL